MKQYRIDVNIADDHVMVCEALAVAINRTDDIHVSRSFHSLEACRQALASSRPDVLLLDISLPDGDGIAFCQEVIANYPKLKIIAISPDPKEGEPVVEEPKQDAEPEEKPKKGSKKKE